MSRSTIRTATDTSGTPRRRKWKFRALTTLVVAAGSLTALAGPAQAYQERDCMQALGPGNVYDADLVRIDTRQLDFGDLPHSGPGAGAPQSNAVIC